MREGVPSKHNFFEASFAPFIGTYVCIYRLSNIAKMVHYCKLLSKVSVSSILIYSCISRLITPKIGDILRDIAP